MRKIYFFLLFSMAIQYGYSQLIFSEPFDYTVGPLQGSGGGTGFPGGSIWSNVGTNATVANISNNANIVAGSVVTGYGNTGNKVQVCTEATKTVFFDRAINLTLNDDNITDYYLSFWFKGPGSLTNAQSAIPAQLIFMNVPNSSTPSDMRLGAGKSSNVGSANVLTGFTRASGESCGSATSWPGQATNTTTVFGTTALALPSGNDTKYVLVKITKKEFTINAGTPATSQYFDGVRIWFLDQPPTGTTDAIFTSRPNGDIITNAPVSGPLTGGSTTAPVAGDYTGGLPIQSRALRPAGTSAGAPLFNSQTCATVAGGVTGIRLRIEGAVGYCFEFDEIRFGIGLDNLLLPITLANFKANAQAGKNKLQWTTVTETDNKGFKVQKSTNGLNWTNMGYVVGAGTTTVATNYSFDDVNPGKITYYRLGQEDYNGRITYSQVVKVVNSTDPVVEVYPNPTAEILTFKLNKLGKQNNVSIYDYTGALVKATSFNTLIGNIDVSSLQSGMYKVRIHSDGAITTTQFMKN